MPNRTGHTIPLISAFTVAIMWGMAGVFIRLLPATSALSITAGRLLVALLATLPIFLVTAQNRAYIKSAASRPAAYLLATLLASYYLIATFAFQLSGVAEVALFLATPPLFVLGFSKLSGNSPDRLEIIGAFLAILGIVLIMAPQIFIKQQTGWQHITGNLLAFSAAAFSGLYVFLYRQLADRNLAPDPVGVTFLTFLLGGLVLSAVVYSADFSIESLFQLPAVYLLLGLGIFSTAISSLGFAIASKHLPAVVTATVLLLIPMFAGIFAYIVLAETLSPLMIPGGLLVLSGIALILNHNRIKI